MGIVLHASGAQFETNMSAADYAALLGELAPTPDWLHLPEHGLVLPMRDVAAVADTEEQLRAITRR